VTALDDDSRALSPAPDTQARSPLVWFISSAPHERFAGHAPGMRLCGDSERTGSSIGSSSWLRLGAGARHDDAQRIKPTSGCRRGGGERTNAYAMHMREAKQNRVFRLGVELDTLARALARLPTSDPAHLTLSFLSGASAICHVSAAIEPPSTRVRTTRSRSAL
jgi:hypothetical protein